MANNINVAPDVVGAIIPQTVVPVATSEVAGAHYQQMMSAALTVRVDEGATYTYIGSAAPGSADGDAVWQIKRLTNADTTVLWADGDANFDNVWTNRGSLTYA